MTTIKEIKNECRQIIAQAEKATPGPWVHDTSQGHVGDVCTPDTDSIAMTQERIEIAQRVGEGHRAEQNKQRNINAALIATSRSFAPRAAKALLDLITYVEEQAAIHNAVDHPLQPPNKAQEALETLRRTWEDSK